MKWLSFLSLHFLFMKNLKKTISTKRPVFSGETVKSMFQNYTWKQVKTGLNKWFTLVELIIVITILAILATIAFVSFQGYVSDARDANRTATIKNIEKWLTLYQLKTNKFPAPDESTPFTGWLDWKVKINQWIVWDNVARVIQMDKIPLDPKDKSKYTYSTFWDDNKYYQVAINAENTQTSFLLQTYAFTPKSAIVQWNYRFDPSLPSLIVVPSSIEWKTIFDPKVCFVIDGWKNSLDKCVEKKEEMSLKDFDNSLVGYWDMETTTWWFLKDLSENGNNGTFSWSMIYSSALTGGVLGKGLEFDWNLNHIVIPNSNSLNPKNITISAMVNLYWTWVNSGCYPRILWKGIVWWVTAEEYALWWSCSEYNKNIPSLRLSPVNKTAAQVNWIGVYDYAKFLYITATYDWKETKIYINWKLDNSSKEIFNWDIQESTKDLFIWHSSWTSWLTRAFYWIIDDVKIYNRALSDEEIAQQAKIAGF